MAKKTLIKGGHFHDGKGKQFTSLQDALANDTKCGCGINCKSGYISIPNFNSESGDKDGFYGIYFADGELVVDPISNVKSRLNNFCGGTQPEPIIQALRLTFSSIEDADFYVGDSSDIANWNTFFDLPTNGNPFTSVEIVGNEVRLFGGSNIHLKDDLFYDTINFYNFRLLSVIDYNSVVSAGDRVFYACASIETINFPSLVSAGSSCFRLLEVLTSALVPSLQTAGDDCFAGCLILPSISLPSLITAGEYVFSDCEALTTFNAPALTSIGDWFFYNNDNYTSIYIPSCTSLGSSTGDDGVFDSINFDIQTLTIPASLMTADAGAPDGDIVYLLANYPSVNIVTV
jgi:hypothetical protein